MVKRLDKQLGSARTESQHATTNELVGDGSVGELLVFVKKVPLWPPLS